MKLFVAVLSVAAFTGVVLPPASPASAAPLRECGDGEGGAYRNITSRGVSCREARRLAFGVYSSMPQPCYDNRSRPRCAFRYRGWRVRGRWFIDRYGNDQQDLRATRRARVVRLQTDWDDH